MTGFTRCLLAAGLLLSSGAGCLAAFQASAVEQNRRTFPPDASQHEIAPAVCATGAASELELSGITPSQHHNGNDGEARFALRGRNNRGAALWSNVYVGQGVCLGYDPRTRKYAIGIVKQHGIGARLTQVFFVDEAARKAVPSAFNKRGLEAFAAVPGPDGRYVALIAIDGNDTALYVLDAERDSLRKLGPAPSPPPLTPSERDFVKAHPDAMEGQWEWMASLRDGYMSLDAGIVTFSAPDRLAVGYGDDTPMARAGQRNVVTYDLGASRAGRH